MSTETGRQAEAAAARYLEKAGHVIIDRNWRTRWCEIDIVSAKDSIVYFVEVKYRARTAQGTGLEYVTSRKLEQMQFAAQSWLAANDPEETHDYRLSAIELSGEPPRVTQWLPDVG